MKRFGRMVVIEYLVGPRGGLTWAKCRCDCGAVREVRTADLNRGQHLSCGPACPDRRKPIARFSEKVREDPVSGCWVWTGARKPSGYGNFFDGGRYALAHRWSFERFRGPLVDGLTLDHLCRNPSCVNPEHLEQVPIQENIARGNGASARNAAKTHCPRGHAYDNSNTHFSPGGRNCRACDREDKRRKREQRKQA